MLRERKNWTKNTVNLSPPEFFLGKVRTGHMRWMDPLVRVLFVSQKQIVAVGKSKVTTTKEQRTTQAGCTTISTGTGAHRTAHFTATVYFSAFRRMRRTQ